MYAHFVCKYKVHNTKKKQTRVVIRGNLIDCPGNRSALTVNQTTFKLLINSPLSTPNAETFMANVIKFYFLNMLMEWLKYDMKIPLNFIPDEIIE